jgi:hypothetical protein
MFKKTIVVLISGRAGTGKSTSAKYLNSLAEKDKLVSGIIGFAHPLKQVAKLMGWDGNKDEKGRRLLQRLGTDVGREYDKEMWCKLLFSSIERWRNFPFDILFIDDWRFPSEYEFVKKQPMYVPITIRLTAIDREILKGTPDYDHISETALAEVLSENWYDFIITNTGSPKNLEDQLDGIWKYVNNNLEYYYNRGEN